jgi:uncharacterized protein YegP (UPF0339 family)
MSNHYEIYKDAAAQYRWRYWANNGRKIADSGEAYHNKSDCQNGINLMKASANAPVVDSTVNQSASRY